MPVKTNYQLVKDFHKKFELPAPTIPQPIHPRLQTHPLQIIRGLRSAEEFIAGVRAPEDVLWGRVQMMLEELREFCEASEKGDLADMADSLADLAYFVYGTAVMMGLPFDSIFNAVHVANMAKIRVASSEESKRLNKLDVKKPEGWTPPDIKGLIEKHTSLMKQFATPTSETP